MPDWFETVHIAKEMGVPPWDLAGVPETAGHPCWLAWSSVAIAAVGEATATRAKQGGKHRAGKTRHFGPPRAGSGT